MIGLFRRSKKCAFCKSWMISVRWHSRKHRIDWGLLRKIRANGKISD